jgi:dTDP-4-dehydrorhamnose reductase
MRGGTRAPLGPSHAPNIQAPTVLSAVRTKWASCRVEIGIPERELRFLILAEELNRAGVQRLSGFRTRMVWFQRMKILLIGAGGQLARDVISHFGKDSRGDELVAVTHKQLEIRNKGQVEDCLDSTRPDCIINTAAFHQVDLCEDQPENAFAVNEGGVLNLAQAAQKHSAKLVQLSTDYVFDGEKKTPYVEDDEARPLSVYGKSRLAGENAVTNNCERYLTIRTCGLYGIGGSQSKLGNFVETMLRLAGQGKPLRVVNDQVCTPTSTNELAARLLPLIRSNANGLFHMTNEGQCSWFEFATEIFRLAGMSPDLKPCTSKEFGAKAKRPLYSVLENRTLHAAGFGKFRPWQGALPEYMKQRAEFKKARA